LDGLALSIQLLTQSFRLASNHSLKHLAAVWAERLVDSMANLEAVEQVLEDLVRHCPFVELAYLVDRAGTMVAFTVNPALVARERDTGSVSVGQSYTDRPWFQAVSREGGSVVTSLYDSLLTGDACFTIAVSVTDRSGVTTGTLGMDVNARNWTSI
jgi:hypothetical protein